MITKFTNIGPTPLELGIHMPIPSAAVADTLTDLREPGEVVTLNPGESIQITGSRNYVYDTLREDDLIINRWS